MTKKKKLKAFTVPKKTAALVVQVMGVTKKKQAMAAAVVHPELRKEGYQTCGWLGGNYYCVDKDGKLVLIKALV